jgi:crotonobetainyl-CoA:carnitine CoA-transferase CaiB-like acyl-CoA transferase
MGGLMSITGEADDKPGGGPQKVGLPIVDLMTGMYTAVAVLAALSRREQTGEGDYIDLALLDVQLAFLANQGMNYLLSGNTPVRHGNAHPNIQPQDVYPCRDGSIAIAVGNDGQFVKFAEQLGRSDLAEDGRFRRNADRVINRAAMNEIIIDTLANDDVGNWVGRFAAVGVPCSPINTIPEVIEEPQIKHREMVRDMHHPIGTRLQQVVSPMRFRNAPLSFDRAPPTLGQHTAEVLRQLGYDDDDIQSLSENNVT